MDNNTLLGIIKYLFYKKKTFHFNLKNIELPSKNSKFMFNLFNKDSEITMIDLTENIIFFKGTSEKNNYNNNNYKFTCIFIYEFIQFVLYYNIELYDENENLIKESDYEYKTDINNLLELKSKKLIIFNDPIINKDINNFFKIKEYIDEILIYCTKKEENNYVIKLIIDINNKKILKLKYNLDEIINFIWFLIENEILIYIGKYPKFWIPLKLISRKKSARK